MNQPRSHFRAAQGLRMHHVEWGDPAAPPLLLVHGGRDHARAWDAVAVALADRWRVIAPDLRGHGDSQWTTGYGLPEYVLDIAALTEWIDAGPMPVIGHSLGGNIVTRYAAAFPERVARLVVMEGLGPAPNLMAEEEARPFGDRMREWLDRRLKVDAEDRRSYPNMATAAARMRETNPRLTEDLSRHLAEHGARVDGDGQVRFKFDPAAAWFPPGTGMADQSRRIWQAIRCPVLLFHGQESWASNPETDGRAACFADARVVSLADAGHWMHHDRPDDFLAAVNDFLE